MENEYDYEISRLSEYFYREYPNPPFIEILKKKSRAYNCLLLQTQSEYFICIPYRTKISHPYAFHFKNSRRSKIHNSGLDYSKMVIIKNNRFIENGSAVIDNDEYVETVKNINKIKKEAEKFLEDYCMDVLGIRKLNEKEFARRYAFSPLKYFHRELNIPPAIHIDAPSDLY